MLFNWDLSRIAFLGQVISLDLGVSLVTKTYEFVLMHYLQRDQNREPLSQLAL